MHIKRENYDNSEPPGCWPSCAKAHTCAHTHTQAAAAAQLLISLYQMCQILVCWWSLLLTTVVLFHKSGTGFANLYFTVEIIWNALQH